MQRGLERTGEKPRVRAHWRETTIRRERVRAEESCNMIIMVC